MVVAFRIANWDTPFWINPNRRDSRYLSAEGDIVQYWSLHPLTCWAEQLRGLNVQDADDAVELRFRPWVADVKLPEATLHVTFANAGEHGIEPFALVDDDWTTCKHWVRDLNVPALIVPSAALPGTENLVLFGPMLRTRWGISPLDPGYEVPCDPTADLAIVLTGLLPHIRWRGQAHAGYEAWRQGQGAPLPPAVRVDRPA